MCISAIIPTRNSVEFISKSIESLLHQTIPPSEIIVIDNGSTDGTSEVLKNYSSQVKIILQPKVGASAARNLGIKNARHDYIAFLDSDDVYHPEKIEKQIRILEDDKNIGMVFCAAEYIDTHGKSFEKQIRYSEFSRIGFLGKMFERNRIPTTSATIVRKKVFEDIGGFDESISYNEEYDLWLRLLQVTDAAYLDEILVFYRIHENNISNYTEKQKIFEKVALQKHSLKTIKGALQETYPTMNAQKVALARVLFRKEEYTKAKNILEELEISGYRNITQAFYLGNIYLIRNKISHALAQYHECLKLDEKFLPALNNLGVLYYQENNVKEAIRCFEKCRKKRAHYADPAINLRLIKEGETHEELKVTLAPLRQKLKPRHGIQYQ